MKNFTKSYLKNYQIVTLFVLCSGFSFSQCPTIVWADEFSGTTLDQTKWNYQIGDGCAEGICGWGNNELQSYQQANVVVSNGTLKITAKKERIRGSQYTSGRINSKAKGDFTYGRFEASIKLPYGDGLWPAFWMLSTNNPYGTWPQSGEIDIMEFVASEPDKIFGTIHYGDLYPNNQFQGNGYTLHGANYPDAFHEFAIEWEPGEIRWFMDGILYSVKKTEDVSPFMWPFDQDFHFLLNVAVGGNLGGTVNNNMLPATMEVDYVRVYDGFKSYLSGTTVVSNQASDQVYTINNVSNNTNVTWTVPSGATIVSGQGTPSITVDFGSTSGDVSASFNDGCATQNYSLYVEVEPPYVKAVSFENFDEPSTVSLALTTGVLTEVSNPSPNAINSSAISGKYDRDSGEQYDLVVYDVSTIADASHYVTKNKKFYLDVYTSAPIGTDIILQLETSVATPTNYPSGRHSRYVATITENNTWQRLAFTLLDRPDNSASDTAIVKMILLFASNSYTGDTYYYDNFDSYNADTGTGSNTPPVINITSPANNSSFSEGTTINITADASDSDGSITQVEFFANGNSIGVDTSQPYAIDYIVTLGATELTAVATDDDNATTNSQSVNITGQTTGEATSIHVSSIVTGTANAGKGSKYGTANVTIVDNLGNPIANAQVTGTFSGTFNESASAYTNSNGSAALQTQASSKGTVTVNFCVDSVVYSALPYEPSNNTVTCSNSSARLASQSNDAFGSTETRTTVVKVYPNPAKKLLQISLEGFEKHTSISILNSNGIELYTKEFIAPKGQLDISSLPNGLYFIKVQDQKHNVKVMRFIK
ncbi:putative secreted protein (Por secretion system target) [Flavobacteriaceae bacterium MAR_2010_72]|nr:putative secreted protein (Por secretion system target) [Flavobacteriaceae bacterium MAR_2010_72]